ncbi:MAG: RagB/SusD family nutrient uptake outer membrane protein [Mangrovibacterium sp.]
MKIFNTSKLIFSVIFVVVCGSCEDYLETKSDSKFTEQSVFDNLDFATKEVYGIYENLTQGDLYDYNLLFFKCDNDIECTYAVNDGARNSLAHYAGDPGSNLIKQTWTRLYQTIERANIAIDNLPQGALWNGEYAGQARRLYGEALTLRALCYYELISLWGDVPLIKKSAQAGDNFYVAKTDRDEIYEFLINDLKDAQEYVPWMSETKTAERINKGFVKGLRARMALACAGFSLRNKTFETRRGKNWEEYYKIANQECRELMASGIHHLNPSFEQVFKTIHAYAQDVQYREVLFEIAFGRLISGRIAQTIGMQSTTNPAEPKYGRAASEIAINTHYYYTFDRSDKRRNTTVELYNYGSTSYLGMQRPIGITGFRPTKWRRMWINPSMGGDLKDVQYTGINWPLMRYADVVLMFAETENEINGGPTQDAKNALASIRQRAFPENLWQQKVTHYIDSVSVSKDMFFNAIVDERAWEFGGEMIRKYDLVRWNLLGDRLDKMREITDNIVRRPNDPPYNFVPTYLYWKYKEDNETIEFLNADYRLPNTTMPGYTRTGWFASLSSSSITSFYTNFDRVASGYDKAKNNHLYPISNDLVVASNGSLSNDQLP